MAKRERHFHKLNRHVYRNNEEIYFCILNCKFKCHTKLAMGKIVLCNTCNLPFEMNQRSCRIAKPNCDSCSSKSPKANRARVQKELELEKEGKIAVDSIKDLNLNLEELKEIKAPKLADPLADLRSRMHNLRAVKREPIANPVAEVFEDDVTKKEDELL